MDDWIGFCLVALFVLLLWVFVGSDTPKEQKIMKAACEMQLPRNQECKMTFVPDLKADNESR